MRHEGTEKTTLFPVLLPLHNFLGAEFAAQ